LAFSKKEYIIICEMTELQEKVSSYLKTQLPVETKGEALERTYYGQETWVASAAYVPFIAPAILILRKDNSDFVSFHARQSLVILVITIFAILLLPTALKVLIAIFAYAVMIFGAYQAIKGRKWYLPVVTELARTIEL
jgi:uncharacterized membrane protein